MNSRAANSYDFVRFAAASAVLFSHHFALSGLSEPPVPGYGEDFGKLAVEVFFSLSGFLICESLLRSSDSANFFTARFLRIYPNLTFALVLTSVATLVFYENYNHRWEHVRYVLRNLVMFLKDVTYDVPGIFEDLRAHALNGPLWSLPSEMWLYTLLFILFKLAGSRVFLWVAASAIATSFGWRLVEHTQFFRLGSFFLSGAVLACAWPHLRQYALRGGVVAIILLLSMPDILRNSLVHSMLLAATVVGIGSSKKMAWFAKGGDASYGMYIFAWPIQQFSILLVNGFWQSMITAFIVTALIGYSTWHAFEKKAMGVRHRLADRLRQPFLLHRRQMNKA